MKIQNLSFLLLVLFLSNALTAQERLQLSSEITTATYNFSNYTAIDISSDFKVVLNFSEEKEEITVEANSNLLDKVKITKEGNTLKLRLGSVWGVGEKMVLNVTISTRPIINKFTLALDAVLKVEQPLVQNNLSLDLSGDSIFMANIETGNLELIAKSDSVLKLRGTATFMNAYLTSDSELRAEDFTVEKVKIKLKGDSMARINVTKTIDAVAYGDSILTYQGSPQVTRQSAYGDSEISSFN